MMPATGDDVAHEIEIEVFIERYIDGVGRSDQQKRVTVRRCPQGRLGADIAGRPRSVLDYELLPEMFRQPLSDDARSNVGRPPSGKPDDDAHRPRRIGLRLCDPRHGRQRSGARGQMQKNFGGEISWHRSPKYRQ